MGAHLHPFVLRPSPPQRPRQPTPPPLRLYASCKVVRRALSTTTRVSPRMSLIYSSLLLLLIAAGPCLAQTCRNPNSIAMGEVCRQVNEWDRRATAAAAGGTRPNAFASGQRPNDNRAYRREYRELSDNERQRFHNAIRTLKANGRYDQMVGLHQSTQAFGAHGGPAFLPWHREFLNQFELALRSVDSGVSLPYWDSTLETYLPNPRDSVLFMPEFMGTTNAGGFVVDGPFRGPWPTTNNDWAITRNIGTAAWQGAKLFVEDDLSRFMTQTSYRNYVRCPLQGSQMEVVHGLVHDYVGGHMFNQEVSPNDPIFFLHHAFVDLLWENWRRARQSRFQREVDYHSDADASRCNSAGLHNRNARMFPFQISNVRGMSNVYTDQFYTYAPRPWCSWQRRHCGSAYLFCALSAGPRCMARVRPGGSCRGYDGADICLGGQQCVAGRCQPRASAAVVAPRPRVQQAAGCTCADSHVNCPFWAGAGECQQNPAYMRPNCARSCATCVCGGTAPTRTRCADQHNNCNYWAATGECSSNPAYMLQFCGSSCASC